MNEDKNRLPTERHSPEVAEFLEKLKQAPATHMGGGRGRLIFALDATASREPTWDRACRIEIQLVYYRGFSECKASRWMTTAADLHRIMRSVFCVGGETQIERVLTHAIRETRSRKVNAMVFVGDAMEEKVDRLCRHAGELGLLGVPIFIFHEGRDRVAAAAFKQIASLSRGAYLSFDLASADRLKELLGAVAVYAAGGYRALTAYGEKKGGEVLRLTSQLKN